VLLEDAKPLLNRIPLPVVTRSHGTPILLSAHEYHGPPSTSTVGAFVHVCNARRMKRDAS